MFKLTLTIKDHFQMVLLVSEWLHTIFQIYTCVSIDYLCKISSEFYQSKTQTLSFFDLVHSFMYTSKSPKMNYKAEIQTKHSRSTPTNFRNLGCKIYSYYFFQIYADVSKENLHGFSLQFHQWPWWKMLVWNLYTHTPSHAHKHKNWGRSFFPG